MSFLHSLLPLTYRMLCNSSISLDFRDKLCALLWSLSAGLGKDALPSLMNFVTSHITHNSASHRLAALYVVGTVIPLINQDYNVKKTTLCLPMCTSSPILNSYELNRSK